MKICFFALEHHSVEGGGGIASYLDAMVPELAAAGHEVHIIVKGEQELSRKLSKGIFLHEFKSGNLHWYVSKLPVIGKILSLPIREIEWSRGFYRRFRTLKQLYHFDVIESSETGNFFTTLFEKDIPLIIRLHGSQYHFEKATKGRTSLGARLDRFLQRISMRRASGVTSPSQFRLKMLAEEMGKLRCVVFVPNAVPDSDIAGETPTGEPQGKTIFFCGRLAEVKGVWPLLEAFSLINRVLPGVRLRLAGASHSSIRQADMEALIERNGLRDSVELLGYVPKEKIWGYYESSDIVVVPSYFESFCLSAVEGMLRGKPVVASSGSALEEIVEDGVTGILVPPGDSRGLADALLYLLENVKVAKRMGSAGRRRAQLGFGVSKVVQETLAAYNKILGGTKINESHAGHLRICFITIDYHTNSGGGGIGSYLYTLSRELSRTGHSVTIICGGSEDYDEVSSGVRVHHIPFGNIHYYLSKIPFVNRILTLPVREIEWSYALWRKIREIGRKEKFDIIESCETGNLFSILFPHETSWVIRAHGATYSFKKYSGEQIAISDRLDRAIQRFCMRRAAALSAPSTFQAREIEKEVGRKRSVTAIPNPVDPQFFEGGYPPVEGGAKGKKTILYTGRIEIRKGTLVLLKAMSHVIRQYQNLELFIAGGQHVSVSEKVLNDLLDSEDIRSHVRLLGHVRWQDIKRLYADCDIFAVPSYYETFCISAVEAMAYGKPVVGAFGTALPEVVDNDVTGLLVPPGDEEALSEAILRLLSDEGLARRIGEAGRKKAAQYRPDFIAKKTLEFYENVVAGKTSLPPSGDITYQK